MPVLCELEDELLLVHHARVARRVLLRDQERRHDVLCAHVLAKQEPARLAVLQRVHTRDRKELGEALVRELDVPQLLYLRVLGASLDYTRRRRA